MEPIGFEIKHGEYIIKYKCLKCGYLHNVKTVKEDDIDKLLGLK
jgi:hypothetical protein